MWVCVRTLDSQAVTDEVMRAQQEVISVTDWKPGVSTGCSGRDGHSWGDEGEPKGTVPLASSHILPIRFVLQEMQVEELSAVRQTLQADLETSIRRIADLQAALEEVESSDDSETER